jgi:hypothetical protein
VIPMRTAVAAWAAAVALFAALGVFRAITPLSAVAGTMVSTTWGAFALRRRWFARSSAARAAAVALALQCAAVVWANWSESNDGFHPLLATLVVAAVLRLAVIAALVSVAFETTSPWSNAGAAAWAVGSAGEIATILWIGLWILDVHDVGALPEPGVAPELAVAFGGLALGAGLVHTMTERTRRQIIIAMIAGYAVLALLVVIAQHRLLALGPSQVEALSTRRWQRDIVGCAASATLASVLWLYARWRRVPSVPEATVIQITDDGTHR